MVEDQTPEAPEIQEGDNEVAPEPAERFEIRQVRFETNQVTGLCRTRIDMKGDQGGASVFNLALNPGMTAEQLATALFKLANIVAEVANVAIIDEARRA